VPVTYAIDAGKRTIRTRCFGDLTLQEILDHFRALEQDPDCPERLHVFLDVSQVDSVPTTHEISTAAFELKRIRDRVRFDACAIVATGDAIFGMMRMFEAMAGEYFCATRTFRVAAEAEAWLALQQELSERKTERNGSS